jgi:hypothetical protein
MAIGKYTISDRQGERMVNAMRKRGEEWFARLTRPTKPNPENVRTTSSTMTKVNNKEDR